MSHDPGDEKVTLVYIRGKLQTTTLEHASASAMAEVLLPRLCLGRAHPRCLNDSQFSGRDSRGRRVANRVSNRVLGTFGTLFQDHSDGDRILQHLQHEYVQPINEQKRRQAFLPWNGTRRCLAQAGRQVSKGEKVHKKCLRTRPFFRR